MFSSDQHQHPHPLQILTCRACDVEPGDEVVIVDPIGAHYAVRAEYLVVDPDRTAVTIVPRDGLEQRVRYEDPVMVLRGHDLPQFLPHGS